MAVVCKLPNQKFVCGTFKSRYDKWYKEELEAHNAKVEWPPIGYQYEIDFEGDNTRWPIH